MPNAPGLWMHNPSDQEIDIYPLEPVGGTLCLWGPDVGISYTGACDTQAVWDTDEWQGHIPAHRYDDDADAWELVQASNAGGNATERSEGRVDR